MTEKNHPLLVIDMVADPICPWCYVGKRSLDRALMALSFQFDLAVRFRPYMLNPDTPKGGLDRQLYLDRKFKDKAKLAAMDEALQAAAQEAALVLDTRRPQRVPNTLDALRVLRWSHDDNVQVDFVEALFAAYWHEGRDISDRDVLAKLAGGVGMEAGEIRARLDTNDDKQDIEEEARDFRKGGVNGVPTFIVNEAQGFAGAIPPDQLLTALRQLAAETPAALVD